MSGHGNNRHLAQLVRELRLRRGWSRADLARRLPATRLVKACRFVAQLEDEADYHNEAFVEQVLEVLRPEPAVLQAAIAADRREFEAAFLDFLGSWVEPSFQLLVLPVPPWTFPADVVTHAQREAHACAWVADHPGAEVLVRFSRRHWAYVRRGGVVTSRHEASLDWWAPLGEHWHAGRNWTRPRFRWCRDRPPSPPPWPDLGRVRV